MNQVETLRTVPGRGVGLVGVVDRHRDHLGRRPAEAVAQVREIAVGVAGRGPARAGATAGGRYDHPKVTGLFDEEHTGPERPGSYQYCTPENRPDYIPLAPEPAERVTGGVCREGLWTNPGNVNPPIRVGWVSTRRSR
jgi:hypothetical protein